MHPLSFFILSVCKTLLNNSLVTAEGFDDVEMGDYDMFATDDFSDLETQSAFFPSDPLVQNDLSMSINPSFFNEMSSSSLSSSDLAEDPPTGGCTSSDFTQDQVLDKRLDIGAEVNAQMCLPQRNNPGKYPGFDPENDPLIQIKIKDPEDEEFCPRQLYFSSYLICDSGYFADRKRNLLTGLFDLNRCQRSTMPSISSSLPLSHCPSHLLRYLNPRGSG